MTALAFHK